MENTWKKGKGSNAKKGFGFVSVPDELKANNKLVVMVSGEQKRIVMSFCEKNKTTFSDLVRTLVYEYISKNGGFDESK